MSLAHLARILRAAAAEADRIAAEQIESRTLPSPDDLLPLRDCGVSVRTLRGAIGAGELPASLVGREYLVRRSDLESWIAARRVTPREVRTRELSAAERALERARSSGALRVVGGR